MAGCSVFAPEERRRLLLDGCPAVLTSLRHDRTDGVEPMIEEVLLVLLLAMEVTDTPVSFGGR
jgi:hypothetical protein